MTKLEFQHPVRAVDRDYMAEIDEPEVLDIIQRIRSRSGVGIPRQSISSVEGSAPLCSVRPQEEKEEAGSEKPLAESPERKAKPVVGPKSPKSMKLKPPLAFARKKTSPVASSSPVTPKAPSHFSRKKSSPVSRSSPVTVSSAPTESKVRSMIYRQPPKKNKATIQSYHVEVQTDRKTAHRSFNSAPRVSYNKSLRSEVVEDYTCVDYDDEESVLSAARTAPLGPEPSKSATKISSRSAALSKEKNSLSPEIFRTEPVDDASKEEETKSIRSLASLLVCGVPFDEESEAPNTSKRTGGSLDSLSSKAKDILENAQRRLGKRQASTASESSFYRDGDSNFFDAPEESVLSGNDNSTLGDTFYTMESSGLLYKRELSMSVAPRGPGCGNALHYLWKDIRGDVGSFDDTQDDGTLDGTLLTGMGTLSLAGTSVSENSYIYDTRDPTVKIGRTPTGGSVMFT